jgi:hypothetical protein
MDFADIIVTQQEGKEEERTRWVWFAIYSLLENTTVFHFLATS